MESQNEYKAIQPSNISKMSLLGDRPILIDNNALLDPHNKLKLHPDATK